MVVENQACGLALTNFEKYFGLASKKLSMTQFQNLMQKSGEGAHLRGGVNPVVLWSGKDLRDIDDEINKDIYWLKKVL